MNAALGWMILAQAFFAGMNVCTRLGARNLPWAEVGAARFLVGALNRAAPLAALSGLGIVLTHLLAIPAFGERPTVWQIVGSLLVIGASLLLTTGRDPAAVRARASSRPL